MGINLITDEVKILIDILKRQNNNKLIKKIYGMNSLTLTDLKALLKEK